MVDQIAWPQKTREFRNWAMDSTHWNGFRFRDDDIVIASYAKAGKTTWTQQMVAELVFNGETEGVAVGRMSPWHDFRLPPWETRDDVDRLTHRRFLKTHLPVDALVFSPKAKYIYVARDGRDVVWSLYNHHLHLNRFFYDSVNALPDFGPVIEPPATDDLRVYFLDWFTNDGHPFWPFWENVRSWWAIRGLPNVLLLHYRNLLDDRAAAMREIAAFLDIAIDGSRWDDMLLHTGFDYMKKHATLSTPLGGEIFDGGAEVFINKGTNQRWCDTLTPEDIGAYEARAVEELGADCAHWLATGTGPGGV